MGDYGGKVCAGGDSPDEEPLAGVNVELVDVRGGLCIASVRIFVSSDEQMRTHFNASNASLMPVGKGCSGASR